MNQEHVQASFEVENVSADSLYELVGFLKDREKTMAVKELTDFLQVVEDVDDNFTPELLQWMDSLQPVLDGARHWKNGEVNEKMFDVRWREYLDTV